MYLLKAQAEDFLVSEVLAQDILVPEATAYHVYLLKKYNYTTERAVRSIVQALKKPRKAISYAGTKDKHAITTQYIVLHTVSKERVAALELKDISLEFVGYTKGHLRLGDLAGNKFTITLRNMDTPFSQASQTFLVPNYFDEQRFSTANVDIGLHLLKKEFSLATKKIQEVDSDFATQLTEHLSVHPQDFIGALRLLPRKTLLFYVHAVQSKIFNDVLAKDIAEPKVSLSYSQGSFAFPKYPLSPTDTELTTASLTLPGFEHTELDTFLTEQYDLVSRNFLLPSMPELSLSGNTRKKYFLVREFLLEHALDELHPGKKKAIVSFVLPKGCYATIVIRQLAAMSEAGE